MITKAEDSANHWVFSDINPGLGLELSEFETEL